VEVAWLLKTEKLATSLSAVDVKDWRSRGVSGPKLCKVAGGGIELETSQSSQDKGTEEYQQRARRSDILLSDQSVNLLRIPTY
jgi:hypothetical protein